METTLSYSITELSYGPERRMYFTSDEKRWIEHIHKLARDHPEEVFIIKEPTIGDKSIYAALPPSYLHLLPRKKRELTPEQKKQISQRLEELANEEKNRTSAPM